MQSPYNRTVSQNRVAGPIDDRFVLSAYLDAAMQEAVYETLPDGGVAGEIPDCPGVIAFGGSPPECAAELRSVLEGWVLLGLQLGHRLPVLQGIDLNRTEDLQAAGGV